ncbi:glutamate receptor U1-like [Atheta coriaria]|uniref:glutamate receptor U1-like n=1 Tax=Dalotia coriaria TaxID=877792 RepID=UPI0031F34201
MLLEYPPYIISPNEGIEVKILKELQHRLNITFEINYQNESATWGYRELNGTWSGLLGMLFADRFMIGIGAISTRIDRLQDFHCTYNSLSENMYWAVPAAQRIDEGRLILIIFTWTTWIGLLVIILIIGVCLWLVSNLKTGNPMTDRSLKTIGSAILVPVQITVSIAVWKQPRQVANRMLFISYALFIIIVGSLYQSSLIKVMSKPPYNHQLSTYEEIFESSLPIGGLPDFGKLFEISEPNSKSLIENFYNISDNDDIIYWWKRVATGDAISIVGEYYIKFYMGTPDLTNQDGSSKIYLLKDDVLFTDTYRITFSKNFVLRKQFDIIFRNLHSNGMIYAWTDYYIKYYRHEHEQIHQEVANDQEQYNIVLTLRHVKGAFLLLIYGNFFSASIFILELLMRNIKHLL